MTPSQEKALIENVLELKARMRHCEAMLESSAKQEFERLRLLRDLRATSDHALRLMRQKEVLLEAIGRMTVDSQAYADLSRMRAEMRQ